MLLKMSECHTTDLEQDDEEYATASEQKIIKSELTPKKRDLIQLIIILTQCQNKAKKYKYRKTSTTLLK